MSRLFRIKYLFWIYLFILVLGSVIPLGNKTNWALMNNYTLHIRWDYLIHFGIYWPLPVLLFAELIKRGSGNVWLKVIGISLAISALFEVLQLALPYRSFNINDLFANMIGVTLGLVVLLAIRKRIP